MGKLICFWSPFHGQCKTTATMLAIAESMANLGKSVMVTHTQKNMADLEGMLNFRISEEESGNLYSSAGLGALALDFVGNHLNSDAVKRAVMQIPEGKHFYLLPGDRAMAETEEYEDRITYVLSHACKDTFDYVFVDLASGLRSGITRKLMLAADLVVVCVSQNRSLLDNYFSKPLEVFPGVAQGKVAVAIGGYDRNSKVVYRNMNMRKRVAVGVVPLNTDYMDAISGGDVSGFFLENTDSDRDDENAYFISECAKFCQVIRKIVGENSGD